MARPPEISEASIIQAGSELETAGKTPNPGMIRAHLGYRGGLLRIKNIWTRHQAERDNTLLTHSPQTISFEALPDEYTDSAGELIENVSRALETLVINAYGHGQRLFEKRLNTIEQSHTEKMAFYTQYEKDVDASIQRLEADCVNYQTQLEKATKYADALKVENAELKGRLGVYEKVPSSRLTSNKTQ